MTTHGCNPKNQELVVEHLLCMHEASSSIPGTTDIHIKCQRDSSEVKVFPLQHGADFSSVPGTGTA